MLSLIKMSFNYAGWMLVSAIPLVMMSVLTGKDPDPMDLFVLGFILMWISEKAKEVAKEKSKDREKV